MFEKAHILIRDAEIAVAGAAEQEMAAFVAPILNPIAPIPGTVLGFSYSIFNATDAYAQWDRAAEKLGLEEGNRFLREFDIRPYAVSFILDPGSNPLLRCATPYIAEWLARQLATYTQRRTLLMFNEGEIPYRLFENDRIIQDFSPFYEPVLGVRIGPELR